MKSFLLLCCLLGNLAVLHGQTDTYTLVIEGYDWGAGVSQIILPYPAEAEVPTPDAFFVSVERAGSCGPLPPAQASGTLLVLRTYRSDEVGGPSSAGSHVTLNTFVAPFEPMTAPMQYFFNNECRGNVWLDYRLDITESGTDRRWNREGRREYPLVDQFDLTGTYTHPDSTRLTYAHFTPAQRASGPRPLLIWLHGGGEGGTDPTVALLANRAANYASPELQHHFDGAHVLVPQTPTFWMDRGDGEYTRGEVDDRYYPALLGLIDRFVAAHPDVDPRRIYLGGCSNGGYMTLKLLFERPKFFAAAYPSALAMYSEFVTDEQLRSIRKVPIWFVHSADDTTTPPDKTVVPLVRRLRELGAKDIHFSYYEHVVDLTRLYGGEDFHYPGHLSWIYSHTNQCYRDDDGEPVRVKGRPVTLLEWMAAQRR